MISFHRKKGQAAMEFLMTYGWAILVVLVVIGALAYFGVLSPSNLLPEKCSFPVSVSCTDQSIGASSILLVMTNAAGRDMYMRGVSVSSQALGDGTGGQGCLNSSAAPSVWRNGQTVTFTLSSVAQAGACTFKDTGRDKNRYNVTVSFSWLDSLSIEHTMNGELLAKKS